jgi:signal transduction histidine kinase/CheY-like chemotaxis protein
MNNQNRYNLVEAEQASKAEEFARKIIQLDYAILEAQANNSLTAEAIVNQQIADCYLQWGKEKVAAIYIQEACACYIKMGDEEQAKQLEKSYPKPIQPIAAQQQKSTELNYFTDEFIATISHEFRTPLNGILGMSETLLEEVFGAMNAQQLNAVSTIDRSGWYLLALINNMVDLSKIQVGKLELEIAYVSVAELCQSSITFVKHHAIQKQIQLDTDIPTDFGYIAVDFQRMRQVFINLVNHAIDSTPAGGKVKLVVTTSQNNKDAAIQFSIIDSSKEISAITNDKFSQSLVPMDSRRIGFGLMLVNPIVELHGGSLSFQSTIGRGSCVSILLPRHRLISESTIEQNNLPEDMTALAGTICQEIPEPPLILIVEDNELNINTISSYLTAKGYRPIVAQDGQAAIEMTQKFLPDLILMDIQMPGMDGLEATSHIRQNPELSSIPIIALTALAMEGDREKCLAAGANEYISKPIKLRQLNDKIQELLSIKVDDILKGSDLWS